MPALGTRRPKFGHKLSLNQKKSVRRIAKNAVMGLAEKKYVVSNHTGTEIEGNYDAAYVDGLCDDITQGDADTQREGDQIRLTSLEIRGNITYQAANPLDGRLVIVMWKTGSMALNANSTETPGLAELLQNGASSQAYVDVFRNDTRKRFVVLYDRMFGSFEAGAGGLANNAHFHKIIPLKKAVCQYDAASSRVTKNEIVVYWFSSYTNASNGGPLLLLTTKLRFVDF